MTYKTTLIASALAAALLASPVHAAPTLTQDAQHALLSALEDEYHAEAFYAAVMDKFGAVRPFSNIINSERTHASALANIMTQYGMTVPANTQLNSAEIKAVVPATLSEACKIGVQAEIDNAGLYEEKLLPAVTDYNDISTIFKTLRDASQMKHLPAFQRCSTW